jgi:tetratricopeptide (TPR) repeat protein
VVIAFRQALLASLAAVVLAGVGAVWNALAFVAAAIAALFAMLDAFLVIQNARATAKGEWKGLLEGPPCRAAEAGPREYRVDAEVLPEGQRWRYVRRDFEDALRGAIKAALAGHGPPLVMLSGPTKVGKTRAAFQTLQWDELQHGWLVVPRDGASIERLLAPNGLPRRYSPLIVWLDDIERYASADTGGFHLGALRDLRCDRPVLLLATEGGRGRSHYSEHSELVDPVKRLRDLAARIEVPLRLSTEELARIETAYGERFAAESREIGLGRRMVAADELANKLLTGRQTLEDEVCRQGVAVIRAAIDWRRMGAQSPLGIDQLRNLYGYYLPSDLDPSETLFDEGARWARKPLRDTEISLLMKATDDTMRFEPYDLAVELADREWPDVDGRVQQQMIAMSEPLDRFQMATAAYDRGDLEFALQLLRETEHSGDRILAGCSSFNLGIILKERGDLQGAEAAFLRADESGLAYGAVNLGFLLGERGDVDGAEAAFRRADEDGDPNGAFNLGILLRERGDVDGAEAAFCRADERGDPIGACDYGALLGQRGDVRGAEAAFRRAEERGNPRGAFNLGVLLEERGDMRGAETAYRRADEHGDSNGAFNVGILLRERGDVDGAEAAFRRADERGDSNGAFNVGILLRERGDVDGAEAAFRRAEERGDSNGALMLGLLLEQREDLAGAEAAYCRAEELGLARGALKLAAVFLKRGDLSRAEAALSRADKLGDLDAPAVLGAIRIVRGDLAGAEVAYRRAEELGNPAGTIGLGALLEDRGDLDGAEAAYRRAKVQKETVDPDITLRLDDSVTLRAEPIRERKRLSAP